MTDDTRNILESMRLMAWYRAKGELGAMLATYYPQYNTKGQKVPNGYEDTSKAIKDFIKFIDDRL